MYGVIHPSMEPCLDTKTSDMFGELTKSPIGRTPSSTPATFIGMFNHIRELFAHLPESRSRGYKPGRFSFNVKGGRCELCKVRGQIRQEMNFLPDVFVECETCSGQRFNEETLRVRYDGHSIADVLALQVRDALDLFKDVPRLKRPLELLSAVGLDYLSLGQPSHTLSGGEAQRIKLVEELAKSGGNALYLMDEPSTGLHMHDVKKLVEVIQRLVDRGIPSSSLNTIWTSLPLQIGSWRWVLRVELKGDRSCFRVRPRNWLGSVSQGRKHGHF